MKLAERKTEKDKCARKRHNNTVNVHNRVL